jgi:serine/threonine protein phosphatase PrpC/CRP-like cAMP-binding protein
MYAAFGKGATDTGKVRDGNEDSFLIADDLGLFIVADGMGGHAAGEVASQLTVTTLEAELRQSQEWLQKLRDKGRLDRSDREGALTLLEEAVAASCYAVYQQSRFQADYKGMGCTLTALLIVADRGFIAHVGDSRLYLHRGGRTNLLTQDHRVIDELLRAGRITPDRAKELNLDNALSRAVGVQAVVQCDVLDMEVMGGDRFLICSDGLHGLLSDDELRERLAGQGIDDLPGELIDETNLRGSPDNVTCIIVDVRRIVQRTKTPAGQPGSTQEMGSKQFVMSSPDTPAARPSALDDTDQSIADTAPDGHRMPDPVEMGLGDDAGDTLTPEHTARRFNFKMMALERVPMFRHLTYKERVSFLSAADDRGYAPGETLMAEGSPGDEFFVLVDGQCVIKKGDAEIATVGAGSPLGDMALVSRNPRTATVVAATSSRAIVVSRDAFYQFLRSDSVAATKVLWAFVQVLTDRLASTTTNLEAARTATARTALEMPIYSLIDDGPPRR